MSTEVGEALGRSAVKLRDAEGKDWELGVLRLGDLADLERELGCSMRDSGAALTSVTGQLTLLWIMLRRVGMNREQVLAMRASGKWPLTRDMVGELFTRDQIAEVFKKVSEALTPAGVAPAQGPSDPTPAATPSGA